MYQRWPNGALAIDCIAVDPAVTADQSTSSGFSWGSELADIVPLAPGSYPPDDCDYHFTEATLIIKTDFPHHIYRQ